MAVDEESFYNVNGEEINRTELVEQMIRYYQLKREAGDTKITDFNEGSEIRNLLESIAVDMYYLMEDQQDLTNIAFVETAEGEWLDKHGANPFIQIERSTGEIASGFVVFTIPEVSTVDIVIPADTVIVSEDTGLEFVTDVDSIIPVGDTSVTVSVSCLTTGEDGNAETNTLTMIDDETLTDLTVTNNEALTGGADYEEDDSYRERIMAYTQSDDFGSIGYYTNLAESIEGVHDVLFVNDNDYTRKILVNGDTKPTPAEVLSDVVETFTDTENIVLNHTFTVDRPNYKECSLEIRLKVDELLNETEVENVVKAVFNGGAPVVGMEFDGLGIGETLTSTTLESALELFDGVTEVVIYYLGYKMTEITPASDEVLTLNVSDIEQTINT